MNIDNMNLKEIKDWVDDEGYLDNVYDPITENTFYWLIRRIEELKETIKYYADMNLYRMTVGGAYFIQEIPAGTRARKALEDKK